MGTLLIDHWLGAEDRIETRDDASISELRERIRETGASVGLATEPLERLAAAASELARNQLAHAFLGEVVVREIERSGIRGVEVLAADHGRGIPDPASALAGTPRAVGSLGVGLSAASRQVDELDVDVRGGNGTCVRIRTFANPTHRSEVGIVARPHPTETAIGDHAIAVRTPSSLVVAVADGLGHGTAARDAAERVTSVVVAHPERSLEALFAEAHAAAAGTRGAVMAIARISGTTVEHAGVGNTATRVIGIAGHVRPIGTTAGTLGSAFRTVAVERIELAPGELLAMFTDGLHSRIDLTHEPAVVRSHPVAVAQTLCDRFSRGSDDALVAVVR